MMRFLVFLRDWVDARLPINRAWDTHMGGYYAPKNFNFWYFFGVLSLVVLVNQLLTGIWLTMMYVPSADGAFASVEYIMRDVDYGWILRYMHSTGASAFFIVVYLHMFRALLYGSYKKPRELVWLFGMLIFVALMAEAFLGYILPWGQMSYWGAQVIVSLFGAIPVIGEPLVEWIRGDYLISGITLNRFFALHVVAVPIILLALVVLHLLALHEVGSNNPDGIEIKKNKGPDGIPLDGVAFHPYYTIHDIVGIAVFLMLFCFVIFFTPEMGGFFLEYANFEEANSLKTPEHIAPVWYFTPFYSVLRAITFEFNSVFTAKLNGLIAFAGSVVILFFLPWLDRSPVKSIRYKGRVNIVTLMIFVPAFIILGYLGVKAPTVARTQLAQVCTIAYFAFFFLMPFYTATDKDIKHSFFAWLTSVAFGLLFLIMFITYISDPEASKVVVAISLVMAVLTILLPIFVGKDSLKPEPERVTMNGGFGWSGTLVGLIVVLLLTILPLKAVGAGGAVHLEDFEPDLKDKAGLQSGAQTFINYCMGCHSMKYLRYERMATDLGIPLELAEKHFIFDDTKIGSLMEISAPEDLRKKWFGAAPPDLTLSARARSAAWLYSYLNAFYVDENRPYGYNNLVFPDVGMPNVLAPLQGDQECRPAFARAANGGIKKDPLTYENIEDEHKPCGRTVHIEGTGTLSPDEFDELTANLVNFMVYAAEPMVLHDRSFLGMDFNKREVYGVFSLLFLSIFFVFAWLLNREYWKGIH